MAKRGRKLWYSNSQCFGQYNQGGTTLQFWYDSNDNASPQTTNYVSQTPATHVPYGKHVMVDERRKPNETRSS